MRHPASASGSWMRPVNADDASRLLRSVAVDLAARVDHRLPGTREAVRRRVVVCGDGDHVVGLLGSFQASVWLLDGHRFDKLTIFTRHSAHLNRDALVYATSIVGTTVHEIAHAIKRRTHSADNSPSSRRRRIG